LAGALKNALGSGALLSLFCNINGIFMGSGKELAFPLTLALSLMGEGTEDEIPLRLY
jgi:hypothetical protein